MIQSSPQRWLQLYIIVGSNFPLLALLFFFVGQPALAKEPVGFNIVQAVVFVATGIALPVLITQVVKPKFNEQGQRVLMPFHQIQSHFIVMGALCEVNGLVGVFLGRGYEVGIGLVAAALGLGAAVFPVMVKMREVYRLTESSPN